VNEREHTWTLAQAQEKFLRIRESNRFSPNTLKNYRAEFAKEREFFGGETLVHELTRERGLEYMAWRSAGMRGTSANKVHEMFREFLAQCARAGAGADPHLVDEWRRIAEIPRRKIVVAAKDMPRVLALADESHPRDRALIALLWYSAIRGSELTGAKVSDVEISASGEGMFIVDRSKSHDYKRIPMSPGFVSEMRLWLDRYQKMTRATKFAMRNWYLIPSRDDRGRLTPLRPLPRPRRIVRPILRRAGFPDDALLGSHTIRRSSATHLYDQAEDAGESDPVNYAKVLLGHQSRRTTEGYIGRGVDDRAAQRIAQNDWLSLDSTEWSEVPSQVAHGNVISIIGRTRRTR